MSRSRGRPGYAFRQMVNLRYPPDIDDDVEGSMNVRGRVHSSFAS